MSLRSFHLFFIAVSVIITAFCGAWAVGQYRATSEPIFVVSAIGSIAGAVGLAVYGTAFQRKTRNL
jgi:hypothetical protein